MDVQKTLVHQLHQRAKSEPQKPALFDHIDGAWQPLSWAEFAEQSIELASGFLDRGIQAGDTVALIGPNRRDWSVVQLGLWSIGAKACPIYATCTDSQALHILQDSGAQAIVSMDATAREKLERIRQEYSLEISIIVAGETNNSTSHTSLEDVRALGRARGREEVDAAIRGLDENTVALLIYTSGTTGQPKGVQLDHGNMLAVSVSICDHVHVVRENPYIVLSYLPLSHIAEQMFSIMIHLELGGEVYFCQDLAEIKDHLPQVRPTVFVGVPRVWEKFQTALESALASAHPIRRSLATWARRTELNARRKQNSSSLSRRIARRFVLGKIHQRLGLDRLVFGCAGAAPTSENTLNFFASLGVLIHEGYGMTETAGGITSNPYQRARFGTVGQVIPGVEVKIADDGEILFRGRAITRGYHNLEAETRALIDENGWLHSGDLGTLDDDGFLQITGRKKEILITAGGKNVAPAEIEARMNTIEGISQSVVMGDREPYLVGLFVVDHQALPKVCKELSLATSSPEQVIEEPNFLDYIDREVNKINTELARYQTLKKFHLIAHEFSVEGGELTPSLKLRRAKIADKYAESVRNLYDKA